MISLYEHNQKAYEAVIEMLRNTSKAAIIHPTGTGKSFIGFKLCEAHPEKRICWLSPSSYIFETQLEALKAATEGYIPENIIFYTYAKLTLLTSEELYSISPDYIILDEFHRCGAPVWGEAVERLLNIYPETPILGLSATNVRYLDSQRDMALELFDGNIASEMTLGEAVVRGILTPPKYVLSVFSYQKDLEKYQCRIQRAKSAEVRDKAEQYLEALRRSLEKADGLDEIFYKHMPDRAGKYIVFCADLEHMRQMKDKAAEWFSKVDSSPYIYSVYSDDSTAEKSFKEFKENQDPRHLKLLYCIDALNEGVHVKNISGVILLRPTISPIIYKQQIGRAMSASATHDVVIFDIVMNIDNLYSISMVKNEMDDVINEFIFTGEGQQIVNESFNVIDEVYDCRLLFDQLNDTLSASWELMYQQAKGYYEEQGDLEVPRRYKTKSGYSLGQWLTTQRAVYRGQTYGILTETQKKKLDAIGMRWNRASDENWDKNYNAAKKYYEENGNLAVKALYTTEDGVRLGAWLSGIRTAFLNGDEFRLKFLTPERKKQLNSIGMIWDVRDYQWEKYFFAARKYFKEHQNLDVPSNYITEEGVSLGHWISRMRGIYQKEGHGNLSAEQISRLESIGISWRSRYDDVWFSFYNSAKEYYNAKNNLDVPSTFKTANGKSLGKWIIRQRQARQESKLVEEKIALLDEIGMVWQKADPWLMRYDIVKRYYEEKGNINISQAVVIDGIWIGKWLSEQRKKKEKLSLEQKKALEELNMKW